MGYGEVRKSIKKEVMRRYEISNPCPMLLSLSHTILLGVSTTTSMFFHTHAHTHVHTHAYNRAHILVLPFLICAVCATIGAFLNVMHTVPSPPGKIPHMEGVVMYLGGSCLFSVMILSFVSKKRSVFWSQLFYIPSCLHPKITCHIVVPFPQLCFYIPHSSREQV